MKTDRGNASRAEFHSLDNWDTNDPIRISCNSHPIYHHSCPARATRQRDVPFHGVLIVHRPRRNDRQPGHHGTCQTNPERKVDILVDVTGNERNGLDKQQV